MARITGLGGIFFKSRDPTALAAWYAEHLGLQVDDWGGVRFDEDEERAGYTLWSAFAADTTCFAPSTQPFMVTTASTISTHCWRNCALRAWRSTSASMKASSDASAGSWIPTAPVSSCGSRLPEASVEACAKAVRARQVMSVGVERGHHMTRTPQEFAARKKTEVA